MENKFTEKEKQKFLLKKHLKNHLFEYLVDIFLNVIFVLIILYLCQAQDIAIGIVFAIFYSLGKVAYQIVSYKKSISKD